MIILVSGNQKEKIKLLKAQAFMLARNDLLCLFEIKNKERILKWLHENGISGVYFMDDAPPLWFNDFMGTDVLDDKVGAIIFLKNYGRVYR